MKTSSDFDERLMREYTSAPFPHGRRGRGQMLHGRLQRTNGIPMTVQPILKEITIKDGAWTALWSRTQALSRAW